MMSQRSIFSAWSTKQYGRSHVRTRSEPSRGKYFELRSVSEGEKEVQADTGEKGR